MSSEVIIKKLDQIKDLLDELEALITKPYSEFIGSRVVVRATERDFQLIVDFAGDINTHLLITGGKGAPDSYRDSFNALEKSGIISKDLSNKLETSAKLRNILVHEYDMEEDYEKFFASVKVFIPAYKEYIKAIYRFTQKSDA